MPDIDVDRAKQRTTLTYQVLPQLSLGAEWNPKGDDLGPLANWRGVDETERRPALILGTSSDRIGTPDGRAYYATLSKDLEHALGLPVAPYAGASYGEFDDELVGIAGLHVRWTPSVGSTHLWDGHNLHHVLAHAFADGPSVGLVVAEQDGDYSLGVTVSTSFAAGSAGE